MRIPTYLQNKHQIDMLTRQYEKIGDIQSKVSSGKNLINSSDDPVSAYHIKSIKNYMDYISSYKNSISMAQNRTALFESTMNGSLNEVSRAVELVKSAQNDTLNNNDRKSIASELEGVLVNLTNYANTRDVNGDYIYAGTNTRVKPFTQESGVFQYVGSHDVSKLYASDASAVTYNESGYAIFGDIKLGNGVATITQGATANIGTAETSVCDILDTTQLTTDTYTVSFVTNSAGKLAYQVVGSASGQIIPAPPLTTPLDAPEYKSGDRLTFAGLSFAIKGTPDLADQFVVSPSPKQNALETVRQIINLLKQPLQNSVDKAAYHQKLGELSASLTSVSQHFTESLSDIGYRSKELERISVANETEMNDQEIMLSKFESADTYTLISELSQRMTSLELTQQTYVKLQSFFMDILKVAL